MSKIKKIIVLGTGGNAIDILDTINDLKKNHTTTMYDCVGFLDDDKEKWNKEYYGAKVLGRIKKAKEFTDAYFVNGIGNEKNYLHKEAIIGKANIPLERFVTIIHPTASVSCLSSLGLGVVVFQNVTIASNVEIGNHAIILPNSIISHDVRIGDYTIVAGGVCISGGVSVGKSCYLGSNSSIIGGISVGDNSLVGMGSVVLENVEANNVMVGNPARFLRKTR